MCRAISDATARPSARLKSPYGLEDLNGELPPSLIAEARTWLRSQSTKRWSFRWICDMLRTDWVTAAMKAEELILSSEIAEATDKGTTAAKSE